MWAAVALGAKFTCDKGSCSGRAGERSNKHYRWETKVGQPPTNKYRQGYILYSWGHLPNGREGQDRCHERARFRLARLSAKQVMLTLGQVIACLHLHAIFFQ